MDVACMQYCIILMAVVVRVFYAANMIAWFSCP